MSAPETTVSFRCDAAIWRRFRSLCDSRDLTPSQVLRSFVREHAPAPDANLDLFHDLPGPAKPSQAIRDKSGARGTRTPRK